MHWDCCCQPRQPAAMCRSASHAIPLASNVSLLPPAEHEALLTWHGRDGDEEAGQQVPKACGALRGGRREGGDGRSCSVTAGRRHCMVYPCKSTQSATAASPKKKLHSTLDSGTEGVMLTAAMPAEEHGRGAALRLGWYPTGGGTCTEGLGDSQQVAAAPKASHRAL